MTRDFDGIKKYEDLLRGYSKPWCLGGGWAIDVFVGHLSRPHADVDIVIWREDQSLFRKQFKTWEWQTFTHKQPRPWHEDEFLQLPEHNAFGRQGSRELEMLMLEKEDDEWFFRRNSHIRMKALNVMVPTPFGWNVLNPAIALLFKSNRLDEKDHSDFEHVLPFMSDVDRKWLKNSLNVMDTQHIWIRRL
ncbi:MAG: hypothetical protein WAZ18_07280 [Alphaproteobacteria bacterium]